ncbi:MAG: hypothetical protein AAF226_05470 [Verrucomicrobiota bacterium]
MYEKLHHAQPKKTLGLGSSEVVKLSAKDGFGWEVSSFNEPSSFIAKGLGTRDLELQQCSQAPLSEQKLHWIAESFRTSEFEITYYIKSDSEKIRDSEWFTLHLNNFIPSKN